MATRQEKEQQVAELKEKFARARVMILADYRGLNVSNFNLLRRQLQEQQAEIKVVKNTLAKIAVKDIGLDSLNDFLEGQTAITFGFEDPVVPAQLLMKYAKEHTQLKVKAGMLEGKLLGKDEVKALSDLPSREVLIARAVGGLAAPLSSFVGVLQANLRNFVYVLQAVKEKKESA
ncbi:MAG: 50S ribosomal protein L10 [Firmicutes bacterium]|nr:50S ribosomal protein L10 [Bacillota bacterium]